MKSDAVIQHMRLLEVEKLFKKLNRFSSKITDIDGPGISWKYTSDKGDIIKYSITKIRDLEGIQDDVENYLIWLWNLKDYFKSNIKNKSSVEEFVNSNLNMKILADVANRLKHFKLTSSRSKLFPKLGKLKIVIPHENFARITFSDKNKVKLEPFEANKCELYLPIFDNEENELIDSFDLINFAEIEWRKYFNNLKVV